MMAAWARLIGLAASAGASLLCCSFALGDPVFFDDFDGDDLKPWWIKISECGDWEYNVSDSMLNVTKIKKIKNCNNISIHLVHSLDSLSDFDATARVGWDEGQWQNLGFSLTRGGNTVIGGIGYNNYQGQDPYVRVILSDGISTEKIDVRAPPPGMYEWRLSRRGDLLSAYLNDELVLQVVEDIHTAAVSVQFGFLGLPDSPLFAPLHVDRVMVAPAPGALLAVPLGLLVAWRRQRRAN